MNKTKSLYSDLYPADMRSFDFLADAFCCDEVKMVHGPVDNQCGPVCVFCEDECSGCETPLF